MADNINPFNVVDAAPAPQAEDAYHAPQMSDQATDPLEDDKDLVIDIQRPIGSAISGLHVTSVLFTINALVVMSAFLIAHMRGTVTTRPDTSVLIRLYTMKVSVANFLLSVVIFFCVLWLTLSAKSTGNKYCFSTAEQARVTAGVLATSLAVGLLRFLAYIMALGQSSKSVDKHKDAKKPFAPDKAIIFQGTMCTFLKIAVAMLVIKVAAVMGYIPSSIYDKITFDICLPPFSNDFVTTFVFTLVCLGSMQFAIVLSEMLVDVRFQMGLQLMHQLMQSEYSTTSLGIYGCAWYALLITTWMLNMTALQCLMLGLLYVLTDSVWAFIICVITPKSANVVSFASV